MYNFYFDVLGLPYELGKIFEPCLHYNAPMLIVRNVVKILYPELYSYPVISCNRPTGYERAYLG